jgi:flagellar basal body-associated protein FliL
MSEAAAEKPGAAPAAGGNKKLLLMVLIFNVVIAGGLAYLVVSGRNKPAEKAKHEDAAGEKAEGGEGEAEGEEAEGEAKEGEAKGSKHPGKFGALVDVGSFVANLASVGSAPARYAKVNLSIEVANEEVKKNVEIAIVPLKSEALMYFSNAKPDDVIGQDKIRAIGEELKKRFNALLGKNTVKRVFFAELVVQ